MRGSFAAAIPEGAIPEGAIPEGDGVGVAAARAAMLAVARLASPMSRSWASRFALTSVAPGALLSLAAAAGVLGLSLASLVWKCSESTSLEPTGGGTLGIGLCFGDT